MPPTVATTTGTAWVDWHGSPTLGSVMVSSVAVAPSTVAATPDTVTAVLAMPRNPVPRSVAVAPGASVAGAIDSIVGATAPAGAATATASVPATPSLSAVIVVVPGLVAMSRPAASIVPTSEADELHVTGRPSSSFPFRSRTTTLSVVVSPATGGAAGGVIVTVNTGTCVTDTVADPDLLSTLALI